MSRNTPTRFPKGVGTTDAQKGLGNLGMPNPSDYISIFEDFNSLATADWVITTVEAGAGSATETATGSLLTITNDAADNDSDFFQWAGGAGAVSEPFLYVAGKQMFFEARFKVSDATQSDIVMGLQITDTTPLDVTDGIFFQKDDGDANLDFHVEKNNTATSETAIATLADDTYVTVGFHYDGINGFDVYVDGNRVKKAVAVTNAPDDEELTISFGIQNGEAVAKVLTVDYIFAARER